MSSDWGPPGLETTSPPVNKGLFVAAAFALVSMVGIQWCTKNVGYVDHLAWHRSCGDEPSEVGAWSSEHHTRRAEEAVNLQKWAARHPGRVNRQYTAFCNTPLHLAARFGREDLAEVLITAGASLEAPNKLDERPLHVAATYGHPAVVKLLLARGADVHARVRGRKTPLHAAAYGLGTLSHIDGRVEVARMLLAAGADVNAQEPGNGFTPLRSATHGMGRSAVMADLLLAHGADPSGADERPPPNRPR
jgi:hypothetical protein